MDEPENPKTGPSLMKGDLALVLISHNYSNENYNRNGKRKQVSRCRYLTSNTNKCRKMFSNSLRNKNKCKNSPNNKVTLPNIKVQVSQ